MASKPQLCTVLLLLLSPWCSAEVNTRAGQDDMPSENRFNFFDAEILQSLANSHRGNVVVSPIGVKTVLGMLLEAAGGRSADQLRTALRLPERQDAIRQLFLNYLTTIKEPSSGIKLEVGSSIFMANNLVPSHQYTTHLLDYYARLIKTDFANPELAARNINNWIYDITRGLIPKLIDPENLQPDTQALVTNAVYFKGRWKVPFDQQATTVKCFYTSPGVCHNTNMMDNFEFFKYGYIQELNADALELPYQSEKFSMLLLAPKELDGIVQLQRDLSHFPVHAIVNALETEEVLVSIPRFEINFSTDLVPNLQRLGIQDIFGPNSNLSGMFERNDNTVHVSNVYHKAKIIVNEAGSEAAAGTGALVIPLIGSTISTFRADRPFLFFIRDTVKGITLFAGRVSIPETATPPQHQRPRPSTSTSGTPKEPADLYDIFTSSTSPPSHGSGQQVYRPPQASRPTSRPTSNPVRPSGSSTSTNEGVIGTYSSNSREPQPVNDLQSHMGARNENPPQPQGYETSSRQTHVRGGDQIVFQHQRTAHSSSNQ